MAAENTSGANTARLATNIGLCRKAGRLIIGTELVVEALRGRTPPSLVLIAADVSDATRKRLTDKCSYYKVGYRILPLDRAALGAALGNSSGTAAAAVCGKGFAGLMEKDL